MKIVNKKKFIRSIVLVLGVMILILLGITRTYSKTEVAYREDYIAKGETLWSIAEKEANTNEYYKNKDVRSVMYEIKKINNLQNETLEIGQTILIPNL